MDNHGIAHEFAASLAATVVSFGVELATRRRETAALVAEEGVDGDRAATHGRQA